MHKIKLLLLTALLFITSHAAFAEWNKQCLDDCFSTGHACNYCDFQCKTEPVVKDLPPVNEYKCPFTN